MNDLKLVHMLCARICHDLITPAHAAHTGLDMLLSPEDDQDCDQILKLCYQSAESTLRRLVFFRAAFGLGTSQFLNFEALKKLITDFLTPLNICLISHPNINFESCISFLDIPNLYRLILNIVFISAEIAPSGGNFKIHVIEDAKMLQINFSLHGRLVLLRPELQQALNGRLSDQDWTTRNVQAIFTHILLGNDQFILHNLNTTQERFEICIQKDIV